MKKIANNPHEELPGYELYSGPEGAEWLVWIHGAGGSARTWQPQIDAFRNQYNILIPNLRGHGTSHDMPIPEEGLTLENVGNDILRLMDSLHIEKAHFAGLSLGSIVMLELMGQAPHRMKSALFAGGVLHIPTWMSVAVHGIYALAKILPPNWLYPVLARIVLPKAGHKRSREIFIREAKKVDRLHFLAWLKMAMSFRKSIKKKFMETPEVPAFLISGKEDFLFLKGARKYATRHGLPLQIIPQCGHVCSIQKPRWFNLSMNAFLKQQSIQPEIEKSSQNLIFQSFNQA